MGGDGGLMECSKFVFIWFVCPMSCGCVGLVRCMSCVALLVDNDNVWILCVVWVVGGQFECLHAISSMLCICMVNSVVVWCSLCGGHSSSITSLLFSVVSWEVVCLGHRAYV